MADFFFDAPWWFPAGLALVGLVLLFSGNRRQEKRMLAAGAVVLALAAVAFAVSHYVRTPTERAVARTRALVSAVGASDWPRLRELLDPDTTVFAFRGPDEIARAAEAGAATVGLKSAVVGGLTAERNATDITVDVSVFSNQIGTMERPVKSSWRLTFQNLGGGFELYRIEPLPDGNVTPDEIERRVR